MYGIFSFSAASDGRPAIRGEVVHDGERWIARVSVVEGGAGSSAVREIVGKTPECRSLDVAVALVVATLLDGLPVAETPAAQGGGGAAGSRAATSGGERLGLSAAVGFGVGLVPRPVAGLRLGVDVQLAAVGFSVGANAYLPSAEVDSRDRGANLWIWHGDLGVCPRLWGGVFPLSVCAKGQLGAIHAWSVGLEPSTNRQRLLALLGIEPRLGLVLGRRVLLQLSAFAGWAAVRPRFTLDRGGEGRDVLSGDPFVLLARFGIIGFVD